MPTGLPGLVARGLVGAVLAALCSLPSQGADAARGPSAARGEQLARLICSACHVVAPDQQFPPLLREPAPPFEQIAEPPRHDRKVLAAFHQHDALG